MQILEDAVPVRAGQLIDGRNRAFTVAAAIHGPGRQQRRGQISDRSANRSRQILAGLRILLELDAVDAEHQLGDAIVLVGRGNTLGIFHGFRNIAADDERQEGAVEQFAVLRISAERRPVIGRFDCRIALPAGMAGGQITARGGQPGKFLGVRHLRGKLDRHIDEKCSKRGAGDAPGEAQGSHWRLLQSGGHARSPREPPRLSREWPFCVVAARTPGKTAPAAH